MSRTYCFCHLIFGHSDLFRALDFVLRISRHHTSMMTGSTIGLRSVLVKRKSLI